jgi:hypothetical protein
MGKYTNLEQDVFQVFASTAWLAEDIKTFPSNYTGNAKEFIRVAIVPSNKSINPNSVAGLFIIDIFVSADSGTRRTAEIADKLDAFLATRVNGSTQFSTSTLVPKGIDPDNTTLYKSSYSITFNFFKE